MFWSLKKKVVHSGHTTLKRLLNRRHMCKNVQGSKISFTYFWKKIFSSGLSDPKTLRKAAKKKCHFLCVIRPKSAAKSGEGLALQPRPGAGLSRAIRASAASLPIPASPNNAGCKKGRQWIVSGLLSSASGGKRSEY